MSVITHMVDFEYHRWLHELAKRLDFIAALMNIAVLTLIYWPVLGRCYGKVRLDRKLARISHASCCGLTGAIIDIAGFSIEGAPTRYPRR